MATHVTQALTPPSAASRARCTAFAAGASTAEEIGRASRILRSACRK